MSHDTDQSAGSSTISVDDGARIVAHLTSIGLASSSAEVIPSVLEIGRAQNYFSAFQHEYTPIGPTEVALVRDLARHAAATDRWDAGSGAVERQAARHLPKLANYADTPDVVKADVVLSSAMAVEAADRCERHSLLRSRAFLRTLEKLEAVQAVRRAREQTPVVMPPLGFADEAACGHYLADRLRRGLVCCPKCGAKDGCIIAARRCWECGHCKRQVGLRTGTVMAHSAIPLRQWFDAVRWILWRPAITTAELSKNIELARVGTVRLMMAKVRAAMAAEDASDRLAELDRHFSRRSIT